MDQTDVVVLGGGPAGYSCALRLADHGLSVAMVEADAVGGTCLHRGCIPTRAMLHAASIVDSIGNQAARWGIGALVEKIDHPALLETRDGIVRRNAHAVERHLDHAGVKRVAGRGRLVGPREVDVDGSRLVARLAIVVATGSVQRTFRRIAADGVRILTTDHAFALEHVPASALILGGGAIGAEFSQIWRAFGCDVTILEREGRLVPMEDAFVGETLARALRRKGIKNVCGIHVEEVRVDDAEVELVVVRDGSIEHYRAEVMLLAAGRAPATRGTGLEGIGVRTHDDYVSVDDALATSVEGVYAVGDVLGPPSPGRANVAFAEGLAVADRIAGREVPAIDYAQVPRVTHGLTETAAVGLSEDRAESMGLHPRSLTMPVAAVPLGLIVGEPGAAKVVMSEDGTVVGIHIVGPRAVELIGEAAAVTSFEASVAEAASIVHPHPSFAEQLQELHLALAGTPLHLRS